MCGRLRKTRRFKKKRRERKNTDGMRRVYCSGGGGGWGGGGGAQGIRAGLLAERTQLMDKQQFVPTPQRKPCIGFCKQGL